MQHFSSAARRTFQPPFTPGDLTLVDGDTLERKNLNRQLFDPSHIGQNKAQTLGNKYGCQFLPEWYAKGKVRHFRHDWLLCLVDNHRTRLEVLEVCDDTGCQAIHHECGVMSVREEEWLADLQALAGNEVLQVILAVCIKHGVTPDDLLMVASQSLLEY